jgi:hypothetical protein
MRQENSTCCWSDRQKYRLCAATNSGSVKLSASETLLLRTPVLVRWSLWKLQSETPPLSLSFTESPEMGRWHVGLCQWAHPLFMCPMLERTKWTHVEDIVACIGDYRRGLDLWMNLLSIYAHDSELQAITAPPLKSTNHKSTQHPLSLFEAAVSSAVPWQRLITMEILQLHALKFALDRLPYRTDLLAPIAFKITPRHGPRRNSASIVARRFFAAGTCLPSRYLKSLWYFRLSRGHLMATALHATVSCLPVPIIISGIDEQIPINFSTKCKIVVSKASATTSGNERVSDSWIWKSYNIKIELIEIPKVSKIRRVLSLGI